MPPAVPSRVVVGLVILLMCAVTSFRGHETTRTRTVTEVVSVTYVPARAATPSALLPQPSNGSQSLTATKPVPVSLPVAGSPAMAVSQKVPVPPPVVAVRGPGERPASVQASFQPRAAAPARAASSRPRRRSAVATAAVHSHPLATGRTEPAWPCSERTTPGVCRTTQCGAAAVDRTAAPPHLPAIFVPVRNLGLTIESKLVKARSQSPVALPAQGPCGFARRRPSAWTSSETGIGNGPA